MIKPPTVICVLVYGSYAQFLYVGATQVSLTRNSSETQVTESLHRQGGNLNMDINLKNNSLDKMVSTAICSSLKPSFCSEIVSCITKQKLNIQPSLKTVIMDYFFDHLFVSHSDSDRFHSICIHYM